MGKFFDFGVDFSVPEDVNQDNQRISDDDIILWRIKYQCSDYTKCPVASK